MSNKLNTKCANCGYTLTFSPKDEALKCEQCEGLVLISGTPAKHKKEYNPQSAVQKNTELNSVFECSSCGAKSSVNGGHGNGLCPYCGSSNINELADAIAYKPDAIVPFKVTKEEAIANYKQWLKTRKFVPNKLHKNAQLNKLEGMYFPCWNFDFNANTTYSGVGIEKHTRTRYRTNANGQRVSYTETYETKHPFSGKRFDSFNNYIQSASKAIGQEELEKLGNYGLETLKVYNTAYLVGFLSSGYDVDIHNSLKDATTSAKREITYRIKREHSYDGYESMNVSSNFNSIMWQYTYLPVYACNFSYNKKPYRFLVNGYTGYVQGKVPRSGWKIFGLVFGILMGIAAITCIVSVFG